MMRRAPLSRKARCGFLLVEAAAVTMVVALMMGALLKRLSMYDEQLEQLAVGNMVAVLRAALTLRAAHLQASGHAGDMQRLAGQNPFTWLSQRPATYVGEFYTPVPETVLPGQWYFNRTNKAVTYLFHSGKYFPHGTTRAVYFTVELLHLPRDNAKSAATLQNNRVALIQVDG